MDQNPLGLADKASENRAREFTREYLNFLDDLVSFSILHQFSFYYTITRMYL